MNATATVLDPVPTDPGASGAPSTQPTSPVDGDQAAGVSSAVAPPPEGGAAESPSEGAPPPAPAKGYFEALPDNWREEIAKLMGDDPKYMKQMARYTDFAGFAKTFFHAQDKIRSGEISNGLPKDATPEQLADWRAANGVPESPDKYEAHLDEGLVLGDADARILSEAYKTAHQHNISAQAMSDLTNAFVKARQVEAEAIAAEDGVHQLTTTRQLKDTWGGDYQTNLNMIRGLVGQMPSEIADKFMSARLADGRAVFNSPEVLVYFADIARKLDPAATVVPNSSNPVASINEEIKALESRMGTNEWYKDQAANDRLMQLYEARERMQR